MEAVIVTESVWGQGRGAPEACSLSLAASLGRPDPTESEDSLMTKAQACCISLCKGPPLSPKECHTNGGISGNMTESEESVWEKSSLDSH